MNKIISSEHRFRRADVDAYVSRIVAEAPPLNDHQRNLLAGLLQPLPIEGSRAA